MDLDPWDCFGRKKLRFITEEIRLYGYSTRELSWNSLPYLKPCYTFQILSPRNGYVLAAKEIRVGHDKVSVKRLTLKLITDLQLYVIASDQIEGALVATAVERDQLLSEFQVCF